MARRHYWQFLVTDEGNPIENAEITIYLAGTETPVYVYNAESGGTGTAISPQVQTSKKGFFEFWVADSLDLNGYNYNQKFKISWYAPGVSAGFVDYIDVFSTSVGEVDVTSTDTTKNKAVSNALAKGWEDHTTDVLYSDGLTDIHGIFGVDESQSVVNAENQKLNKLISNTLGNKWDVHVDSVYTDNPHGIEPVDETDTDATLNKLVSNALAKGWQDATDLAVLSDGSVDFTAPQIGVDPTLDQHLATKIYVDNIALTPFDQDLNIGSDVEFGDVTLSGTIYGDGSGLFNVPIPNLDQIGTVNIPSPNDDEVLTYSGGDWISSPIPPAVLSLNNLTDVTLTSPVLDHFLTYNGSYWQNTLLEMGSLNDVNMTIPQAGEVPMFTGVYGSGGYWDNVTPSTSDLSDFNITSPQIGDIMFYDGSDWVNGIFELYRKEFPPVSPESPTSTNYFAGESIAISGDGNVMVIGEPGDDNGGSDRGQASIYTWSSSGWVYRDSVDAPYGDAAGDQFGYSVSTNYDGSIVVVGAPYADHSIYTNCGAIYFYNTSNFTNWNFITNQRHTSGVYIEDGGLFGLSLSRLADNGQIVVGAPVESGGITDAGAAHLLIFDGSTVTFTKRLVSNFPENGGKFGWSVAISNDVAGGEQTIVVGAPNENSDNGRAYVFGDASWNTEANLVYSNSLANEQFGWGVAISGDGQYIFVGAPYEDYNSYTDLGVVEIFEVGLNVGIWDSKQVIFPEDGHNGKQFGSTLDANTDGSRLIVSAITDDNWVAGLTSAACGSSYIFRNNGQIWLEEQKLYPSIEQAGQLAGRDVSMTRDGKTVIFSAKDYDSAGVNREGITYTHKVVIE